MFLIRLLKSYYILNDYIYSIIKNFDTSLTLSIFFFFKLAGVFYIHLLPPPNLLPPTLLYSYLFRGKEPPKMRIVMSLERSKPMKRHWTVSDRILLIQLISMPFDVNIFRANVPAAESNDDSIDAFKKNDLDSALNMCRHLEINIILEDFKAKIGYRQEGNISCCGFEPRPQR